MSEPVEDHPQSIESLENQAMEDSGEPESTRDQQDPAAESGDVAAGEEPQTEPADPLETAQQEILMWKDAALRAKADLENYRKRMARERSEAMRFANMDLLHALLPILDNFELGLQAAKAEEGSGIYQGMSMVYKQIEDFLADQNVKAIAAVGEEFDPNLHEAVSQEANDAVPSGGVISQLRRGYLLHDRLLRPAAVSVSTGAAQGDTDDIDTED